MRKGETKKDDRPGQKSFNQFYIELILKSVPFREKVEDYLKNKLILEIMDERSQKIQKLSQLLLKKCEETQMNQRKKDSKNGRISVEGNSLVDEELRKKNYAELLRTCDELVLSNSKLKFPWTEK